MWDKSSKAKGTEISLIEYLFKMISFKNLALTKAALVVPGITLYMKKFRDSSLWIWFTSIICLIIWSSNSELSIGLGCKPWVLRCLISSKYLS